MKRIDKGDGRAGVDMKMWMSPYMAIWLNVGDVSNCGAEH
jgi:hypothetical protein